MTRRHLGWLAPAGLFVTFAIAGYAGWGLWDRPGPGARKPVVRVPDLSLVAQAGRQVYDRRCVQCHGVHGGGGPAGPPLVHPIYRPAHHGDAAFSFAVQRGVRAHHWRLGDMPSQPDVGSEEIAAITQYIRELQAANAIE